MANLNFSILDLLLFTGLILLFFRVRNNGFLKELVFISILFTYCYLTLNNLKTVYDYFDDEGFDYAQSIYNVFLGLFACAGLPFVNFFTGLYIPKLKGSCKHCLRLHYCNSTIFVINFLYSATFSNFY